MRCILCLMKSIGFPGIAILLMAGTAFMPAERTSIPESISKEYIGSTSNVELQARFEAQFFNIFADVSHVDIHQNQLGDYYYTVYGSDASGDLVVDYFKTTEEEVKTESYNYIEMNERTLGRKVCRETTIWPPPSGYFCHATNSGYICGIEFWPGVCILY